MTMLSLSLRAKSIFKRGLATATNSSRSYPKEVTIVEVGPRDGLQNEKQNVETSRKIEFIDRLSSTGLKRIETTSFVSPKWVPQLADAAEVMQRIDRSDPSISYSALTPNLKGFQDAMKVNTQEICIFGNASETFARKNINTTIDGSLEKCAVLAAEAKKQDKKIRIRGYVSCIVGCPYEGPIEPKVVAKCVAALLEMGCYEVSLGDTIGVGNPKSINRLFDELKPIVSGNNSRGMDVLAIHCHDTYNMALVNILQALEQGVRVVDSSCAGLGGCPYAGKGVASGNVATEDVLYMLHGLGVSTGVDMDRLLETSDFIMKTLNRQTASKVGLALGKRRGKNVDV